MPMRYALRREEMNFDEVPFFFFFFFPLHLNGQRQIKWQGGSMTPCRAAYCCCGSWLFSNSGRGLKFSVNILRRVRNRSMGVAVCLMLQNGRRMLRPSSYSEW